MQIPVQLTAEQRRELESLSNYIKMRKRQLGDIIRTVQQRRTLGLQRWELQILKRDGEEIWNDIQRLTKIYNEKAGIKKREGPSPNNPYSPFCMSR